MVYCWVQFYFLVYEGRIFPKLKSRFLYTFSSGQTGIIDICVDGKNKIVLNALIKNGKGKWLFRG